MICLRWFVTTTKGWERAKEIVEMNGEPVRIINVYPIGDDVYAVIFNRHGETGLAK